MSFYSRYNKNKEKLELTPQQKKEQELKTNALLIVTLLVGFAVVLIVSNKFRIETSTYDDSLYIEKSVSDINGINDIKPLYEYETKETPNYNTIEVSDTYLYEEITDDVYLEYEKYNEKYNDEILKEFKKENIEYLQFEIKRGSITKYYYIINNNLYMNETGKVPSLEEGLDQYTSMLDNKNTNNIYNIVESNTATHFGDYLQYVVDINYYIILSNKQNSFAGYAHLNNGKTYELSLINFVDIIKYLEES